MSSTDPSGPQPTAEGLSRREVMRRTGALGAAGVGMATGGDRYAPYLSPVQEANAAPWAPFVAGGIAALLVYDAVAPDLDEAEELEGTELHAATYAYAQDREPDDEDALESMESNVSLLEQQVRRDVSFVIAEEASQGEPEEDVVAAAEEQLAETVRNYQENLIQRWERHVVSARERIQLVYNEEELHHGDVIKAILVDGSVEPFEDSSDGGSWSSMETLLIEEEGGITEQTVETEYVDGDQLTTGGVVQRMSDGSVNADNWATSFTPFDNGGDEVDQSNALTALEVTNPDPDDSDRAVLIDSTPYREIFHDLEDLYEDELGHMQTLVDQLYQPIKDGEVSAHEVASGSALLDEAGEMDHWRDAAAVYHSIAIPSSVEPVGIEVDGVEMVGELFWTLPPDEGGLSVGDEINPDAELGEFYAGVEITDAGESELEEIGDEEEGTIAAIQLTEPFTITDTESGADVVVFDQVTTIEPDPEGDHQEILDAIKDAYDTRQVVREERHEIVFGDEVELPGLPDDFTNVAQSAVMGLAVMAGAALVVVSVVTNLFDNLLP